MIAFLTGLNATSQVVKAANCQILGYHLDNTANALPTYFQFFSKQSPTVGTDAPAFAIAIPAGGAANIPWLAATNTNFPQTAAMPSYAAGVTIAATTTATGNTAPGSNCTAVIFYI